MARLRRADCSGPGITRRAGRARLRLLRRGGRAGRPIPRCSRACGRWASRPRGSDVWICPDPNGHLQATGIDAAGRKQYRYHDAWRTRRDAEKFDDMTRFARALPRLRERVEEDLAASERADPRARAGLRGAAARPRLLPRSAPRSTRSPRVLRARDDPQGARAHRGRRRWSSTIRPRAASGASRRSSTRSPWRSCARSSAAAAAARSCSPTRPAATGATCARPTSTPTSRKPPATTSRPRTSAPGARPCSPRSRSRSPAARTAAPELTQARDHPRDQGDRALPRQHARGLPRVLHRPAHLRRLPRRPRAGPATCSPRPPSPAACSPTTREIEQAVLDLLNEREAAPGIEPSPPNAQRRRRVGRT